MQKNLRTLDSLQEIDLKLDRIASDREALVSEIAELDARVEEARNELSRKKEEHIAADVEKLSLEETLSVEAENIVRSESRLKEIKTQKEYQAVSKEISTARKMKAELEEQLIRKICQIDEFKAKQAEDEENISQLESNIAAQKAEVLARIDNLESGATADRIARDEKSRSLPPAVMKRYTMLREQRRGIAVVEAKDGSCLGCNINLPPQVYNTLFRESELITCPHCQRILVLRKQES